MVTILARLCLSSVNRRTMSSECLSADGHQNFSLAALCAQRRTIGIVRPSLPKTPLMCIEKVILTRAVSTAAYQFFELGHNNTPKSEPFCTDGRCSVLAHLAFAARIAGQHLRVPRNSLEPRNPPTYLSSLGRYRILGFLFMDKNRLLNPACPLLTTLPRSTYRTQSIIFACRANSRTTYGR